MKRPAHAQVPQQVFRGACVSDQLCEGGRGHRRFYSILKFIDSVVGEYTTIGKRILTFEALLQSIHTVLLLIFRALSVFTYINNKS